MSEFEFDAATGHAAIVALAVVVLGVIVALTAVYAHDAMQIVAYSGVYVLGVTGFWLVYWRLSRRAGARRRELLEAED